MARGSNRTGSGSTSPAAKNTRAAPPIFFASPPAETMLRGGQCLPAARERVQGAPRRQFGSDLAHGFGFRAGSWTPGGNPPSLDPKCCRVGPPPGQGLGPLALGLWHQGNQERVLLRLVKRGGAESENSAPMGSELET